MPSGYVPPELRPLIGPDTAAITEGVLRRLIGLTETQGFEAKQQPYGNSDGEKRELASDVAALANRNGGLLVIGLSEDSQGAIAAVHAIPDDTIHAEELRIPQIIAAKVTPAPAITTDRVSVVGGTVLLVSVPPSVRRPHAVVIENGLRFPIRDGSTKRYLSESEVADLYRSRFVDARTQVDLAQQRHRWLAKRRDHHKACLVVTIQPDRSGSYTVTRDGIAPLRSFGMMEPLAFPALHGPAGMYVSVAFRGLSVTDLEDGIHTRGSRLWLDGAGSTLCAWPVDDAKSYAFVSDEDLLGAVVNALGSLATWATRWCETSGDAAVMAELLGPDGSGLRFGHYRNPLFPDRALGTAVVGRSGVAELTVSLDGLAADPRDVLAVAREITREIESSFGFIGPLQVSLDGTLREPYFYQTRVEQLRRWADRAGVEVTDETVD